MLEGRLRSGITVADIEREFRAPPQQAQQAQQAPPQAPPSKKDARAEPLPPPVHAPPTAPSATPVVGRSMGMRQRNPLDLIRRSEGGAGVMSKKPRYLRTPLTALLEQAQAAMETGEIVWYRVSALWVGLLAGWVGGTLLTALLEQAQAATVHCQGCSASGCAGWRVAEEGAGDHIPLCPPSFQLLSVAASPLVPQTAV